MLYTEWKWEGVWGSEVEADNETGNDSQSSTQTYNTGVWLIMSLVKIWHNRTIHKVLNISSDGTI